MSTKKTRNYQLHQWEPADNFLRAEFNENFTKLDAVLKTGLSGLEAGLGESVDVVTISTLMVLVPGVALTNAMREIMAGDTFSALSRTADAILVASAIALGAAAGQALGGLL